MVARSNPTRERRRIDPRTGERTERRRTVPCPASRVERRYGPRGALSYVEAVLARRVVLRRRPGKLHPIPACEYVRLACERSVRDRAVRSTARRGGWRFNGLRAAHFVDFVQTWCRHVKGELTGQLIHMEPWQVWQCAEVFGWEDARGFRRFKTVYEEVARKNAKSTKLAAVGLYATGFDGEQGADVYSAATTYRQASVVFKIAQKMVRREPQLLEQMEAWAQSVTAPVTDGLFEPLHAKSESQEGLNVHTALVDEYHAHKDDGIADVLTHGKGARRQPLIWYITTSGANRAGPCYAERAYAIKVLQGVLHNEEYWAGIWTLDKDDDWQDEANWIKANPNLGVSVRLEELRAELLKVQGNPRKAVSFKTKRMNLWVGALEALFDVEKWKALADPGLTARLAGLDGVLRFDGCDFASRMDLSAIEHLFRYRGDGTRKRMRRISKTWEDAVYEEVEEPVFRYHLVSRLFVPEGAVEDLDNRNAADYRVWIAAGWLEQTEGPILDFEAAKDAVREDFGVDLAEVGFDQRDAAQISRELGEEGFPFVKIEQNTNNLSEPTKELEALIAAGLITHDGNECFTWMLGNVKGKENAREAIYPRKEFRDNKIDGPVGCIIALRSAMDYVDSGPSLSIIEY